MSDAAISDKEAELYDRQIRLWGVEAQQRLRGASVFIVGLSALGAEVTKNLVLAGFSVTLVDAAPATARDLGAQFFLDASSVGTSRALASQARAQDLNRLVTVAARVGGLADAELRARPAPLVVLCDLPTAEVVATCARCRAAGAPVLAAASFGLWGALFQDAGEGYAFERAAPAGGEAQAPPAASAAASAASASAAAAAPPPAPQLEAVAFKPLEAVLQGATFAALARNKRAQPMAFAWVGALRGPALFSPSAATSIPLYALFLTPPPLPAHSMRTNPSPCSAPPRCARRGRGAHRRGGGGVCRSAVPRRGLSGRQARGRWRHSSAGGRPGAGAVSRGRHRGRDGGQRGGEGGHAARRAAQQPPAV